MHNPHTPAVRVRAGNRSEDEMAHFWVQVLPRPGGRDDGGAGAAEAGNRRGWGRTLEKNPKDTIALYNLASLSLAQGDARSAGELYGRLLMLTPKDARALTASGAALETAGDDAGAARQYGAALAAVPGYYDAGFDLGSLRFAGGEVCGGVAAAARGGGGAGGRWGGASSAGGGAGRGGEGGGGCGAAGGLARVGAERSGALPCAGCDEGADGGRRRRRLGWRRRWSGWRREGLRIGMILGCMRCGRGIGLGRGGRSRRRWRWTRSSRRRRRIWNG